MTEMQAVIFEVAHNARKAWRWEAYANQRFVQSPIHERRIILAYALSMPVQASTIAICCN